MSRVPALEHVEVAQPPAVRAPALPASPRRWLDEHGEALWRAGAVVLFFVLWQVVAMVNQQVKVVNPLFLVPPLDLRHTLMRQWHEGILVADLKASLSAASQGYVIGCLLGLFTGIIAGYRRLAQRLWDPVVQIFRPIPPLAFLPMFILYLGIGELTRVLFIAYSVYFYTYMSAMQGVRHVDPLHIRAALSLGASHRRIFWTIILPASMPHVMTGLRVSAGMSLFVLVAAELIAADAGIGYRIMWARQYFEVDTMLFDAFLIGFLGFLIDSAMRRLERRILRWKP
ncbi:MAG TPA: ABC transporter permease [Casimicrobiaceae bacterium]|jgi:ABC-type nitrate/sulfonate/bicarbonate transport system permease component